MIYPEHLKKGDLVGLVAPAFPITADKVRGCVTALEALGLRVKVGETLGQVCGPYEEMQAELEEIQRQRLEEQASGEKQLERCPQQLAACRASEGDINMKGYLESAYLGGHPKQRAEDINRMFADPEIKAVLCARGGYGSAQIMRYLDYELIRRNPKILAGFSDITNLLNALVEKSGLVTYHAPMVASNMVDAPFDAYSRGSYETAMFSDWDRIDFMNPSERPMECWAGGRGEGILTGGNVTVYARMCGTFYQPDTRGKILFLEDVGEEVSSIDMYLTQMDNAGMFDEICGLVLGDFNDCENRYNSGYSVEQMLKDRFADRGIPVLAHVRSGHERPMGTLPIGAWCEIDADAGTLCFLRKQD